MNPRRSWLSRLRFQYSLQSMLILVLLWSAALGTWSYFRQLHEKGEPVLVIRDRYAGVIFPRNTLLWNERTAWEPTAGDIECAEKRIPEFLRAKDPELGSRLGDYVRQYFGLVAGGHRIVECSFIHRKAEWTEAPVHGIDHYLRYMGAPSLVVDGGDYYFQLRYDPGTDICSDLHVNAGS